MPAAASRQTPKAMADKLLKTLAANVKLGREELGLSQRDLAAAVKTSHRRIAMIETATANPTILTIARLAKCLDRTIIDLLTP